MTTRIVETEHKREIFVRLIQAQKLPFTATLTAGKHRTNRQNRLQRQWVREISEQLAGSFETPEHARGHCKLHFGVPILREENEAWRLAYDTRVKPLPYDAKLGLMMEPISIPVTSVMTTKQKKDYLDAIWRHFSEMGVILTDPENILGAAA